MEIKQEILDKWKPILEEMTFPSEEQRKNTLEGVANGSIKVTVVNL